MLVSRTHPELVKRLFESEVAEVKDGTVSYRLHGEQATTTVPKEEFLAMLKDEIATKKINPAALK